MNKTTEIMSCEIKVKMMIILTLMKFTLLLSGLVKELCKRF